MINKYPTVDCTSLTSLLSDKGLQTAALTEYLQNEKLEKFSDSKVSYEGYV